MASLGWAKYDAVPVTASFLLTTSFLLEHDPPTMPRIVSHCNANSRHLYPTNQIKYSTYNRSFKHLFTVKVTLPLKIFFFNASRDEQKKQQLPRQLLATDPLNISMIIFTLWPPFGTIGIPCLSTFRITLPFFNNSRIRCVYETITKATSNFQGPFLSISEWTWPLFLF